jgi:hypothetical protein
MSASGGWLRELDAALAEADDEPRAIVSDWLDRAREIKQDRESVVHGFMVRNSKQHTFEGDAVVRVEGEAEFFLTASPTKHSARCLMASGSR